MQASVAIKSARVYLNDINGTQWSDAILMPFLQEAFGELMQDLDLNSIGVMKYQTNPITVPTGTTSLPNQPTNILEPISLRERNLGEDNNFFEEMIKVNFLPEEDIDEDLTWWSWNQEIISFLGATRIKEVVLRYTGSLVAPQLLTDPIGVIYGERFLGPRIAAMAKDSINQPSKSLTALAEDSKYTLIQRAVKQDQTPIRRKGYRSPKGMFPGRFTVPISAGGGGGTSQVINFADGEVPSGVIDGINTIFTLLRTPVPLSSLELYLNGILQQQGVKYILVGNTITFTDPPQLGDDLLSWYRF